MNGRTALAALRAAFLLSCVSVAACPSGDDGAQDGFETGACINGACLGGLQCISNVCVNPAGGTSVGSADDGTIPTTSGDPITATDAFDDSSTGGPVVGTSTTGETTTGVDSSSDGGPPCPTVLDGVCDEPEGTGTCPEGTDVEDCAPKVCGGAPAPFPAACNQWVQDCPDGEKCNPYSAGGGPNWDALGCFPIECGAVGVGQTCTVTGSGTSGLDNCVEGAMCWSVDGDTDEGYCAAMCEGSPAAPTCADPTSTCAIANDGVISLCLPECDPLMSACVVGEVCAPIDNTFACAPDASGAGGAFGDPCAFINNCDPGLACIGTAAFTSCGGAAGCCTTFCDVSDPGADAACAALDPNQLCEPWFIPGMAPLGFENVGVCTIPV